MKACDLFSLEPKEIKEYLESYDVEAEFFREKQTVYPTTREEKIFGLESYIKDSRTTRWKKIIKRSPIVKLLDNPISPVLSVSMGKKLIIVVFSSDFRVIQINTGGDFIWIFKN